MYMVSLTVKHGPPVTAGCNVPPPPQRRVGGSMGRLRRSGGLVV